MVFLWFSDVLYLFVQVACEAGSVDSVQFLIDETSIDANKQDNQGENVGWFFISKQDLDLVTHKHCLFIQFVFILFYLNIGWFKLRINTTGASPGNLNF